MASLSSTLSILKPTLFCSRLFSLMPYSFSSKSLSVPTLLYTFLLSIPVVLSSYQRLKLSFAFYEISTTITFLALLEKVCSILLTFSSWLLVLWNYQDWFIGIEGFLILEKWMKTLNVQINVTAIILFQCFEICVSFTVVILQLIRLYFISGVSILLFTFFSIASNTFFLVEFVNCLLLLKLYLKTLNIKLMEISKKPDLDLRVLVKRRFVLSSKTVSRLQNIHVLREIHRYLFNLCKVINSLYSVQLLLCIAKNITSVVIILYTFLLLAINSKGAEDMLVDGKLLSSFRLFISAAELWLIVYVCGAVCEEANFTSVIIHGLLNEAQLVEVKEELQLFSHQLLHQKISFSACGFFTLDFTLINAVIASVATYLVILIQFQMST